jgi:hypothetical protein
MGRLIKWLFILAVFGAVGLTAYAYVGPWLGADFSPDQQDVRQQVTLDAL